MIMIYFSIILTVLSNILYHIFQKYINSDVDPVVSLIITYITAIFISLIIFPFFPERIGFVNSIKNLNWASFALGGAIVGLEVGFLLAYRAGWQISLASVISNVSVAVFLVPIGMLFFKESLNILNILGMILCITGLILIK